MLNVSALNIAPMTGSFSQRLAEALSKSGMTKSGLAKLVRVTPSAVSQWLSRETKAPSPANLFAIADALNYSARWLATGKGPARSCEQWGDVSPETMALAQKISSLSSDKQQLLMQIFSAAAPDDIVAKHLPPPPRGDR